MSLLPDPILEGVGDSLLTATDRCAYTISVPRMYKIVGREGVALPPSGAARSQVDQGRRRGFHRMKITKLPQCNV